MLTLQKISPKEKSAERIKQNGEVFTPDFLVKEMIDKLPKSVWEEGKTFCDPAVGDGQFLVHVLQRKLEKGHNPLLALRLVYGVDIMRDSIKDCRIRLLKLVQHFTPVTREHIYTVMRNIVWVNQKHYPNGSLDYDFSFKNSIDERSIQRWLKDFNNDDDLPVNETENSDIFSQFE